ncbi:MAG: helix-turn-helix domain-containing protein [Oscillospiraceae bacterium]|nr:helix-turn-helix domain-containing protein [Oscillospiraceae bacterium]
MVAGADNVTIGGYLRKARIGAGLTQQAVGDALGVTPQAVSKWERGESLPDILSLPELASMYGVGVGEILAAGAAHRPAEAEGAAGEAGSVGSAGSEWVGGGGGFGPRLGGEAFAAVLRAFREAVDAREVGISGEVFAVLSGTQRDMLLKELVGLKDCGILADEAIPYLGPAQRAALITDLAEMGEYGALERLLPYSSREVRTKVLVMLLGRREFGFLQEMFLYLNKEQKDMALAYFTENEPDWDFLDGLAPYLDKGQRHALDGMERMAGR